MMSDSRRRLAAENHDSRDPCALGWTQDDVNSNCQCRRIDDQSQRDGIEALQAAPHLVPTWKKAWDLIPPLAVGNIAIAATRCGFAHNDSHTVPGKLVLSVGNSDSTTECRCGLGAEVLNLEPLARSRYLFGAPSNSQLASF